MGLADRDYYKEHLRRLTDEEYARMDDEAKTCPKPNRIPPRTPPMDPSYAVQIPHSDRPSADMSLWMVAAIVFLVLCAFVGYEIFRAFVP